MYEGFLCAWVSCSIFLLLSVKKTRFEYVELLLYTRTFFGFFPTCNPELWAGPMPTANFSLSFSILLPPDLSCKSDVLRAVHLQRRREGDSGFPRDSRGFGHPSDALEGGGRCAGDDPGNSLRAPHICPDRAQQHSSSQTTAVRAGRGVGRGQVVRVTLVGRRFGLALASILSLEGVDGMESTALAVPLFFFTRRIDHMM